MVKLRKVNKIIPTLAKIRNEMTAERDIAGFALPFSAGILSAGLLSYSDMHQQALLSGLILITALAFMMHGDFCRKAFPTQIISIAAAAFSCGILCHISDYCTDISSIRSCSIPERAALGFCAGLKETIDSIPFENQETGALIKALITGDRTSLTAEVSSAFRESGASHILALSGMHLGIIYGILTHLMSLIGNSRAAILIRSTSIIALCGFYTLATGAGESITRAFLFILLNELAKLTHRKPVLKVITMSALVIQLASDPSSIRSASFQLSYAAIAGIAFIYPHIKNFWPDISFRKGILEKIWENASMSVSCQITTGPLAWHLFRSAPRHFLLTNLIAIPLTGIVIPLAILTTGLSYMETCPAILILLTEKCAGLLTDALRIISSM